MIGHPELISDPRFCTFEGQAEDKNRETFETEYWYPWTMEHTRDEIMEAGQKHRNIIGTVNTAEDLLASPHLKERGYWAEIEHPVTGNLTYPGSPAKLDKGPWLLKLPAPLLGQHNEEVYGKLGYTKDDMVKLMERNII